MDSLVVRAIRTRQAGTDVYAFFVPGIRLLEIAEISRISQDGSRAIAGFQRPEIRSHVSGIVEYLSRGSVLFPNAIILALAPGIRFTAARGSKPKSVDSNSDVGTLSVPIHPNRKAGWIVDGQQRTLALAEASNPSLSVPVIAFVSPDISVHREQFILVNKAKPLSRRLIDELLPEVGTFLPRDLSIRRAPSALCASLNNQQDSPFYRLIRRPSLESADAIITDSSIVKMLRRSIQDPRGSLASHTDLDGSADLEEMYHLVVSYWTAVKDVFPEAWGIPPTQSRLMHAAGIEAMGILMDQIMSRAMLRDQRHALARSILEKLAPACRWTAGEWESIGRAWNEIQYTPQDVRLLSNLLISLERDATRSVAA